MSVLHIGLVQAVGNRLDIEANLSEGESWCRRAKGAGADVALFPEMSSTGYDLTTPGWEDLAQPADGPFVTHFPALAAELDMAVAISFLEAFDGPPRNSVAFIDRHGRLVLLYAKVHTCDFDLEAALTPRRRLPGRRSRHARRGR
jgi:N-carbamoylputrescine amidase